MPKRAVLCVAQAPFVWGGADVLIEALGNQLRARGVSVEFIKVPFKPYPKKNVLRNCLTWRMLDLEEYNGQRIDLAICTKFPSYLLNHHMKKVWLVHQFREVYELWGTPFTPFPDSSLEDMNFRELVQRMDKKALIEASGLLSISKNVASRLRRYTGIESEVVYPLPKLKDDLRCDGYGDELLFAGRLDPIKRVDMLLKAMALTSSKVHLTIAGTGPEMKNLEAMAQKIGVAQKVTIKGFLCETELLDLYANCFSVIYAPFDEDFGFAPLEAFFARKPVITCSDSGGACEFVRPGRTGIIVDPNPAEIAMAIDQLFENRALCAELGHAGYEDASRLSWDYVIEKLLCGV